MKIIVTFGSKHLQWLHNKLKAINVALNEALARQKIFNSRIGKYFATSYLYDKNIEKFTSMGMKEYSLLEIEDFEWKPSNYGVVMADVGEYIIYHNQYDNNYTINKKTTTTAIKTKLTKNQMLDFINNTTNTI